MYGYEYIWISIYIYTSYLPKHIESNICQNYFDGCDKHTVHREQLY